MPNEWQGSIRYARHTDIDDFTKYIYEDTKNLGIKPSLAITHLNETDDKILFRDEDMPLETLIELLHNDFRDIYISRNRYDIEKV
jgi:adenylosuccinate synthase